MQKKQERFSADARLYPKLGNSVSYGPLKHSSLLTDKDCASRRLQVATHSLRSKTTTKT
jgi:hypothetical protein